MWKWISIPWMQRQKVEDCSPFSKAKMLEATCSYMENFNSLLKTRLHLWAVKLKNFHAQNLRLLTKFQFLTAAELQSRFFINRQIIRDVWLISKNNQMFWSIINKNRALISKKGSLEKYSILNQWPIHCIFYLFSLK